MIKKLFFTAALLVPGLAYGGPPSAIESGQIVPSGSPPPNPAVPAGAAAAGFTTLAANYDFTKPLPANWLGCLPADGQTHQWYFGNPFNDGVAANNPPCSSISQVNDPLTETLALKFAWLPAYGSFAAINGYNVVVGISMIDRAAKHWTAFPANSYIVARYRVTNTLHGSYSAVYNPTGILNGAVNNPNNIEYDDIEMYGDCRLCDAATIHNTPIGGQAQTIWSNSQTRISPSFDPTQYHTFAMRTTSDGSAHIESCSYVDDKFINCIPTPANPIAPNQFLQKNPYLILLACNLNASYKACSDLPTGETDMYITSFQVWTCDTTSNQYCNGAILAGPP